MKKFALLLFVPLMFSCANYETVTLVDSTPIYETRKTEGKPLVTVPANTEVMMAGRGKHKKVKYKDTKGYALSPNYAVHTIVKKTVPTP